MINNVVKKRFKKHHLVVLQKEDLSNVQQSLYKVVEPIKINTIKRLNKSKKWKYGYNKEHDVVVISKTGQIGDIYEIQNFKIALPKHKDVYKFDRTNGK